MAELKIGMVGLDTSHCPAFAGLLNNPAAPAHVPGGRVVAAFPGGSDDFSRSRERVAGLTARMRDEFGLDILDSIEAVADRCDAVLLHSVDGRQHREQFTRLAPFGKPVFIDKPLATGSADARAIYRLSEKHRSPVFSASALRYANGLPRLPAGEKALGCLAWGPAEILPDFPGLFWYGIHGAEVLFTMMGSGCRRVAVETNGPADTVVGTWGDGRTGVLYAYRVREAGQFGCTVFAPGAVQAGAAVTEPPWYACLLARVIEFLRTGCSPVPAEETFEIIAFLEAAERARASGRPEPLAFLGAAPAP